MKTLCVLLVLALVGTVVIDAFRYSSCTFTCMRIFIKCKRLDRGNACCAPYRECIMGKCKEKEPPSCSDSKRGSWNKRHFSREDTRSGFDMEFDHPYKRQYDVDFDDDTKEQFV